MNKVPIFKAGDLVKPREGRKSTCNYYLKDLIVGKVCDNVYSARDGFYLTVVEGYTKYIGGSTVYREGNRIYVSADAFELHNPITEDYEIY